MFQKMVLGIEFDDLYVKFLYGKKGEPFVPCNRTRIDLDEGLGVITDGVLNDKDAIRTIIADYVKAHNVHKNVDIRLLIQSSKMLVRYINMPNIPEKETAQYIRGNKDLYMPPDDEYVFDYKISGNDTRKSIMLFCLPAALINAYLFLLGEMRLHVSAVGTYPACLAAVFRSDDDVAIVLDCRRTWFSLLSLHGADILSYERNNIDETTDLLWLTQSFSDELWLRTPVRGRRIITLHDDYENFKGLPFALERIEPFDFHVLLGLVTQKYATNHLLPIPYAKEKLRMSVRKLICRICVAFLLLTIVLSYFLDISIHRVNDRMKHNEVLLTDKQYTASDAIYQQLQEAIAADKQIQQFAQAIVKSGIDETLPDRIINARPTGILITDMTFSSAEQMVTITGVTTESALIATFADNLTKIEHVKTVALTSLSENQPNMYGYTLEVRLVTSATE